MTLAECRVAIASRESHIESIPLPVRQLHAEADSIAVGSRVFTLKDDGLRRFASRIRAPFNYIKDIAPPVRATLLQHHIDRGDLGEEIGMLVRDSRFLAFADTHLHRMTGGEVLEAVLEGIGSDAKNLKVHRLEFLDESFEADLLGIQTQQEVVPGDVVQAGLKITHSFIAEHAEWVEAFVFRLVCSNGLVHRQCVSRRPARSRSLRVGHPGGTELQRDQVRRLAKEAWAGLESKLSTLRSLADEQVSFEPMVLRWLERARLSTRDLLPLLRTAWEREGAQPTSYGLMNALTHVATHAAELPYRQRRALSRLAGLLAFRRIHLCPRCFSLLRGPSGDDSILHTVDPVITRDVEHSAQTISETAGTSARSR